MIVMMLVRETILIHVKICVETIWWKITIIINQIFIFSYNFFFIIAIINAKSSALLRYMFFSMMTRTIIESNSVLCVFTSKSLKENLCACNFTNSVDFECTVSCMDLDVNNHAEHFYHRINVWSPWVYFMQKFSHSTRFFHTTCTCTPNIWQDAMKI